MSITVNKCAKCGHEWPQSSKRPPRRCPAPGCRTVKWQRPTGHYVAVEDVDGKIAKDAKRRAIRAARTMRDRGGK